jgi:hypothetical protein
MPVAHLRVCTPCGGRIRFSDCSNACQAPNPTDPDSWRVNMQDGAGEMLRPEVVH